MSLSCLTQQMERSGDVQGDGEVQVPIFSKEKRGEAGAKAAERLLCCGTKGMRCFGLGMGLGEQPGNPKEIPGVVPARCDHRGTRTPQTPWSSRAISLSPTRAAAPG